MPPTKDLHSIAEATRFVRVRVRRLRAQLARYYSQKNGRFLQAYDSAPQTDRNRVGSVVCAEFEEDVLYAAFNRVLGN
jgi:hypothetical protein